MEVHRSPLGGAQSKSVPLSPIQSAPRKGKGKMGKSKGRFLSGCQAFPQIPMDPLRTRDWRVASWTIGAFFCQAVIIWGSCLLTGFPEISEHTRWLWRVESKAGRFGLFVDRGGFWTSSKILGPLGNIAGWGTYEEFDDYPKGKSKGKAMKGAPKMPKVCEDQNISRKNWKHVKIKPYISIYKAQIQYYTIIIIIISY